MELNELEQQRFEKMSRLQEAGHSPYPHRSHRSHTVQAALADFEAAEKTATEAPVVTVAGRIISIRVMGKVAFAHIEDGSGKLQLFLRQNELGEEALALFKKVFDLGDFAEAHGVLMRTRTGEISLQAHTVTMLAKAITPLPIPKEYEGHDGQLTRYSAFSDVEERFRQRYADLAVNAEVREIFRTRSRMISALRTWLDEHEYLEVETPVLQPIYGGAAARPFTTYHNQLKQQLYLRISFELYLKRLLVGMYERVYEIGRDFRNEGVSYKHNPEFTQLELYCAYTDLQGMMETTEQMIAYTAQHVLGTYEIPFKGQLINLTPPWRRIKLRDIILTGTGIDYTTFPDAESLRTVMRQRGYDAASTASWGHLVDNLLSEVEPSLIQPTFVYDYPIEISPLAKQKSDDPTHVERFELFIGGMETGNAFTELNDPFEQEKRFVNMGTEQADEDDESHPMDEDYLRAMKYGMPPNGGFGMGIDRLAMLLTDKHSIREVLLYPHLRAKE
ncbi:MAG TPA: lysine--tRNA ligase [Anaerolineae bacterium]|nr:lysine--tRNA ligase [Anaerolineae bacterium]